MDVVNRITPYHPCLEAAWRPARRPPGPTDACQATLARHERHARGPLGGLPEIRDRASDP
jgi:hypothetical protein